MNQPSIPLNMAVHSFTSLFFYRYRVSCPAQGTIAAPIAPIREEVVAELGGQATIAKVNVNERQQHAARSGVQGIPALILFKYGQMVGKLVGLLQKQTLLFAIRSAVGTPS